jgi:hypothetical protein
MASHSRTTAILLTTLVSLTILFSILVLLWEQRKRRINQQQQRRAVHAMDSHGRWYGPDGRLRSGFHSFGEIVGESDAMGPEEDVELAVLDERGRRAVESRRGRGAELRGRGIR